MDVNFCSRGLTTTVNSSCVTSDGYEVDNLISSDFYKKQKGFLAETFIKPPITLSFEFVCDCQINYLVIQSNVGAQKSAGLEVFTTTNLEIENGSVQDTKLNSVASGVIRNEEIGFIFYRHGFDVRKKVAFGNFVFSTFKSSRYLVTRVLTIKIFKTFGSSIPALGRVEVWGRPHSSCPKNVIDNVYNCWKQHSSRSFPVFSNSQIQPRNECNAEIDSSVVCSIDFKIPDEFLDPITCEIMVLPVILPCGKVIDKFTLEKHNETESHWGRSPNDPFTGVLFSETNKPVIASDLKARIDKFMCDNSSEKLLMNVPRTVGRKLNSFPEAHYLEQRDNEKYSSLNAPDYSKSSQDSYHKSLNPDSFVLSTFGNLQTTNKEKYVEKKVQHNRHNNMVPKFSPYAKNGALSHEEMSTLSHEEMSTLSHEEMSKRSLDNLLKKTLSSLPSVCQTSVKDTVSVECFTCRSDSNLFQMPCIHVVCRSCLVDMVNKKQLICTDCNITFKASDVRRIHI